MGWGLGAKPSSTLHCPDGPPELRESMGLAVQEVNRIAAHVHAELAMLCRTWRMIHGDH